MKTEFEPQFSPTPVFSAPSDGTFNCDRLQREQQDALLDLYWQGYHAIYPVFDEADFRRHYESLWDGPQKRRACPLVDIVIALCIHFGSSYMASDTAAVADKPGYGFYLQAQKCLSRNLEEPSLRAVQCYFLSAIYLLAFDQVNSAYMMVGTAVRAAESLGLPYDDPAGEESNLTNPGPRLWTCLTILDTQLALYLGRPFAIQEPQLHSHAGAEPDHIAHLIGPTFSLATPSSINWLRFQYERSRLFQVVREIHTELMTVCEDVLEEIDAPDFYQHPASREKCAQYLSQHLKRLKTWVDEVPEDLKTRRQQGVPFSVDRSHLNISGIDPIWLQRQRLILELEYHSLTIMLTRTFNSFLPTPALGTFSSDNHCILSVNSAVMITNMLHQVVSDTGILTGWYQLVDWQRTAAFALAGFACGYPICTLSPAARKALTRAAAVFEEIGSQDMSKLASNLREKCLERVQAFCTRLGIVTPVTTPADSKEGRSSAETPDESSVPGSYEVMSIGEEGLANFGLDSLLSDSAWAGETPSTLLWGDLMRDLDTGLANSLGHVGVGDSR
ncbi:hypothetical protein ACJ41O_007417 [Fusarium nematophilum]